MDNKKIKFVFHPYNYESKGHIVEKEENGKQRRYIEGIASGMKTDALGEKMTAKCIKSFMDQANSGDILLYPDVHGIRASEDIGILKEARIFDSGDWWISNRLYDEDDGIGTHKKEIIDTLWKQMCGSPPYSKPKQKGFSIEGYIPPGGIIEAEMDQVGNMRNRVMDNVLLDGVVLVPRPAYKSSIATAVFKALGELTPEFADNVRKSIKGELANKIQEDQLRDQYYKKKWDIQDALETSIEKIMRRSKDERKEEQIKILFDEYSKFMTDLIIESESLFIKDEDDIEDVSPYGEASKNSKIEIFRGILSQMKQIQKSYERRL